MAADGKVPVPLRQKTRKKNQGICVMSRRRISCKDLGLADFQGWLYKKKEKGSFIGSKWKKFWCVLKGSSLYWYRNQLAEKAEGFLSLPNFTVDQAMECKKKYAIKITHPKIKTFYFAAENAEEMITWLNKLGLAVVKQVNIKNEEECYSESDHEEPEINMETPPPPYSDKNEPEQQEPSSTSLVSSSLSSPESSRKSQGFSSSSLSKALHPDRQSWLDFVNSSLTGEEVDNPSSNVIDDSQDPACLVKTDCNKTMESGMEPEDSFQNSLRKGTPVLDQDKDNIAEPGKTALKTQPKEQGKCSIDEMEKLYKSLEQASLSPIGDRRPSTKRELRKSFIKRSKNPSVNEKLHKIRALNSTLKCKEHDLAMINQLLEDRKLTARKYREWKNTNSMLVQDIYQQQDILDMSEENIKEPEVPLQTSFIESTI
ncbi:interactor protein for cytohesin exchange factors 1 isoform X1 [Heteronotia binoei]|uniref:interactor protein for cytohesin exchange factors 1 isoform X1 n=2 Tax=Heteronotia binoei TaxID=13085 RepID=UPI00292CF998|nr:interactor protein for cytohesin exchange factors 1 isoform X1 [Heteronotia binoei]